MSIQFGANYLIGSDHYGSNVNPEAVVKLITAFEEAGQKVLLVGTDTDQYVQAGLNPDLAYEKDSFVKTGMEGKGHSYDNPHILTEDNARDFENDYPIFKAVGEAQSFLKSFIAKGVTPIELGYENTHSKRPL